MTIKKNKTINNFLKLMRPYSRSILFLVIITLVLEAINLIAPYILKELIDGLLDFSLAKINWFFWLIIGFFFSILFSVAVDYFKDKKIFDLIFKSEYDLTIRCQEKLLSLDLMYHQEEGTGDKVTKVSRGVDKFVNLLGSVFWEFLPVLFQFLSTFIILTIIDYRLALILLIFSITFLFMNVRVNGKIYPVRKERYKKYEEASGKMVQSIINVNTVQSFSQEKRELDELSVLRKDIIKGEKKEWAFILKYANLREALVALGRSLVLIFGIYLVVQNQLSIGTLVFVITLSEKVFSAISRVYRLYDRFAEGAEGVNRLSDLLATESNIKNTGKKKLKKVEGAITFKDVNFSYNNSENTLENLNLHIPAGAFTALVGPSGGGKTTIIRLIFRHFEAKSGAVLLDGINIKDIDLFNFRSFLSIVPQEVDIFNSSIFDNISYANKRASFQEVEAAAKIANASEFIEKLPNKYNTIVGERGIKLSGGQRQRIGIARAVLANPKILVFDEATSNLDTESEKLIQDAILKISHNKTIIVIAHRLSTIKMADKIIVIEKGKVSEEGTHTQLSQQEKGLYKKLISLQSLGDVK